MLGPYFLETAYKRYPLVCVIVVRGKTKGLLESRPSDDAGVAEWQTLRT